ncbi:hypothetical protein LguiB_005726 [Lonicera macranthoides]
MWPLLRPSLKNALLTSLFKNTPPINRFPQMAYSILRKTLNVGVATVQLPNRHGRFCKIENRNRTAKVSLPKFSFTDLVGRPVFGSSNEPQQPQGGWLRTFTVAAYKTYFDVDTTDVLEN